MSEIDLSNMKQRLTLWTKLARLRLRVRVRLVAEGAAWTLLACVGLVFVTLGLDYILHLNRTQRVFVLAAAAVAIMWVLWRFVFAPLFTRMGWESLAMLVEDRYRILADRLISTVQFAAGGKQSPLTSRAMEARTASEAERISQPLNFAQVVEYKRLKRILAAAACAVMLLVGFAFWQGPMMKLWAQRMFLLQETPWPQKIYLKVRGGPDFQVLRGEDLQIKVVAMPGTVKELHPPAHITLHARYPSVGLTQERLGLTDPKSAVYTKVFQAVSESFDFYVEGGDDKTDRHRPHRVEIIEPPALRQVRFVVEYPPYMSRRATPIVGASGVITAYRGGWINISAAANKPLKKAEMLIETKEGKKVIPLDVKNSDRDEEDRSTQVNGRFRIEAGRKSGNVTLCFDLVDTMGYNNRRGAKYAIQIMSDGPPQMEISKSGVGAAITPRAIIPLEVRGSDTFGIVNVDVMAQWPIGAGEDKRSIKENVLSEPASPVKSISIPTQLDLAGSGVTVGKTVSVFARGADCLPKELHGPNIATTQTLTFNIVEPEELLAELVRRQKALHMEFLQSLGLAEEARAKTASAADKLAAAAAVEQVRGELASSADLTRSVAAECEKTADTLAGIVEELLNNRLSEPGSATVMELSNKVIEPLRDLSKFAGEVASALEATRRVKDGDVLGKETADIAADLQRIRARMEEILEHMQKAGSRQELAGELKMIIKWSQQLLERINKKKQQDIEGILGPTTKPREDN